MRVRIQFGIHSNILKMKTIKTTMIIALIGAFVMGSCKKEDEPTNPTNKTGTLAIQFEHVWGMNAVPIDINQKIFHPKTFDTITLTTFKYYVSHVEVKKADGDWYKEADIYHLIDLGDPSTHFIKIENLPVGDYDEIKFVMGVDSLRNTGGDQSGDLDPSNGMFWDFAKGYIMVKAEGVSPNSPTGTFTYHLGGFTGPDKNILPKYQMFSNKPAMVRENEIPYLIIQANPAKIWHNYGSVANGHEITMPGPDAHQMAFDFQDAVTVSQINN